MPSLPPALPFLAGALLLPFLPRRARSAAFLVFPVLAFLQLLALEPGVNVDLPFLGQELVVLRVDRLSLAFGYVFALMSFIGGVYGYHLKDVKQQVATFLYVGSSAGVVFAGDLLTLIMFWEVMAVSSAYLIWARGTLTSFRAAVRYLLVHVTGGSILLGGILAYFWSTGSLAFGHLDPSLGGWLILLGFAINAAVPPLHPWLPDAYPQGTITGSVFMSAFTTKTAVYALARGFAGWDILIWAGVIMALYGVVYAVLENDIRGILSYHIISQVGYMVAGVGIGTEIAINGATAHAFAHILYKGLLFMGAGSVLYATGRSKLTELGGLWRKMPLALVLYMVGAVSISGFPLFSGFISKSMVIFAAEEGQLPWAALLLYMASVGTFLSIGLKLPYFAWSAKDRGLEPRPLPANMYAGMGLAAAACLILGVAPGLLYNQLPYPVEFHPYSITHLVTTMQLLLFTGVGFYLLLSRLKGKATVSLDTDWFYRRLQPAAFLAGVTAPSRLFGAAEQLSLRTAAAVISFGANPVRHLLRASPKTEGSGPERAGTAGYDPDRYRLPVGVAVTTLLLFFSALFLWNLG